MRLSLLLLLAALFAPRHAAADEPETLLSKEQYEGLAEEASRFIAHCRDRPERCATAERLTQLGRAFLIKSQALWRIDGLIDGEAIANGLLLLPRETDEWLADLPPVPDSGPSPWVLGLQIGVAGQIPTDLPGRVDAREQPDPSAAPPKPLRPLPDVRLTPWLGAEDLGVVTAEAQLSAGIGYDGHLRRPPRFLALAMQLSLAIVPLGVDPGGEPPNLAAYGWSALGGPRLLLPATGHHRPEVELDFLIGPSKHGTALVGYYAVNGNPAAGFLSLRLNGRLLFRSPKLRIRAGPILRLETQPVVVLRRLNHPDGSRTDTVRLRWNGHWALGGLAVRWNIARGVSLQMETEWGPAMWGDHSTGTMALNARCGVIFGEGQEP